jgi:hypothetical protein
MLQASVPNVSSVFQIYVASVFIWICICFTHMLQVFYLVVAYVCNGFQVFFSVFASVSDVYFKCFICLVLYDASVVLDISKVDWVLHIGSAWEAGGGANGSRVRFGGTGDVHSGERLLLGHSLASPTLLGHLLARCMGTILY